MNRRRLYLMRHAEVAYFDERGQPVRPGDVSLTPEGVDQARAAAEAFDGVEFDRVITSGLPRTLETARLVARGVEPECWPDLRELEPGRLRQIPADELEEAFVGCFRGVVPEETRFLGGETIGALLDRVLPAVDRLLADPGWDVTLAVLHGGVNRAILSYGLTGGRTFLGGFEQAPACINVVDVGAISRADRPGGRPSPALRGEQRGDWIVRAVNVAPYDLVHRATRETTMERLYAQYRPEPT